jgi:hypothetical protein
MIIEPGKAGLQSCESRPLDDRPQPCQLTREGDGSRVDARGHYCPQQRFGRQLMQADLHVYPLVDHPGEHGRKLNKS